jgi:hypothetical protein
MNFILLPWPKGSTYFWTRERPASTSFARSNAALSPLAKTTRSFRRLRAGAAQRAVERILPCPASTTRRRSFASRGSVLPSMTIWPSPLLDAMPPWPAVTCSKASALGSEVIRISARSATSRGETAGLGEALHRRRGDVEACDFEPVLRQVAHHRRAHDAKADDAEALRHLFLHLEGGREPRSRAPGKTGSFAMIARWQWRDESVIFPGPRAIAKIKKDAPPEPSASDPLRSFD